MHDDHARARYTRRTIIDIARRRQRPGSGSLIRPNGSPAMRVEWPDVSRLLTGIPHAIAGGVATREYMPERATPALDIVVLPADAARVAASLSAAGYARVSSLTIGGAAWRAPDGTPLDILEGSEPWWGRALAEAGEQPNATGAPVLPLHWLVLMELSASRAQDVADVARMLGLADEAALAQTRATIRAHAPDLSDDLASLIALGQLETGNDRPSS